MKPFLIFVVFVSALFSQSVTASLKGTVQDSSGGILRGVTLRLVRSATNQKQELRSDDAGRYGWPRLSAGTYRLEASRDDFKTAVFDPLVLSVNEARRLDIVLAPGDRRESVTVAADTLAVETQMAVLSGLVDSRRVSDLPLNGRNFAQLINLQPGVAFISPQGLLGGNPDGAGFQGSGQFVNGARGSQNNFLLDGGDANDPVVPTGTGAASTGVFTGSAPGVNALSLDAIQEFRVITSGAPAEFGRSSGAVVNIITKSGSNQVHGTAFEYLRNRVLNARDTFEARKPGFSQNNFGATFGGPLVRDRSFLFGSYEGFRQRQQVSVLNNVPSPNTIAAVKRQNALLGAIFDAYYSGPAAAQPGSFTDLPVDAILARGVPVVGAAILPRGNGVDQDAGLIRFDQNLARGWSLNGRYQVFQAMGLPGTISGRGIAGSNIGYENRSQNAVVGASKIVSAHTLLDVRAVFQRNTPRSTMEATPQALLEAGRLRTSGPNAGQPYGDPETPNGVPTISTVGFDLAPIGYETTAPNRRAANTFQYAGNVTHSRGAHTLKFGGELRRIQENSVFSFRLRPEITYASGGASSILLPGSPFNVYDQNIFLLPPTSQRGFRLTEWAGYAQDTWRVLPRLTVDLGVRYESFGVPSEVNGILNNGFLVPGSIVLANADVLAQGPRALRDFRMIATGAGRPYSFYRPDRNNFAPRVGLAWQLRPRTALRLGYGFFYDRMFNNVFGNARNNPPYTLLVTLPNAPFGAIPAADSFTTTLPIGPVTINPVIRSPYTQRFNATLQREFAGFLAEMGYAGARAQRLVRTLRPNQGAGFPADFRPANIDVPERPRTLDDFRPLVYGNISMRDGTGASTYHALQASLQRRFARGLFAQASYTWGRSMDIASGEILNDVVVTTISNRMPLRTADGLVPMPSPANVNQVRAQQGLTPFANVRDAARWYNDNFLGPEQWGAEIGNSAFDIRQIFVANVGWELPWAKRRWYGGWQVAGIVRLQTGVPFSLSTGIDVNGDGNAPDRAALLAGDLKSLVAPEGRRFLLPSAPGRGGNNQGIRTFTNGAVVGVSATPDNVFSYTRRGALHGPALRLVDFSVLKNFALTERARLQFRAEAFNILNGVNYGLPVANVASPRFGEMLTTAAPPRQIQMGLRVEF